MNLETVKNIVWANFFLALGAESMMIIPICLLAITYSIDDTYLIASIGDRMSYKSINVGLKRGETAYERLFIEVDRPHPALHIIHAPRGIHFVPMNATMHTYSVMAEEQRCVKVNQSGWGNVTPDLLTAWTTTDVPNVAILLVSPVHFEDVNTEKYNGTNFLRFWFWSVDAAKGSNNNITASKVSHQYGIFVCNPLNQSAQFDVVIVGEKGKYKAIGTETEWVGKKSMSVTPSNLLDETIIAQYEFYEPCNETLSTYVSVSGRQKGGLAVIIVSGVWGAYCVASLVLMILASCAPRCVLRFLNRRSSNDWLNIPDHELAKYEF